MSAKNGTAPHNPPWYTHIENVKLRDKVKDLRRQLRVYEVEAVRKQRRGHCAYCGAPAKRSVCHAHSDLIELDPGAPK